MPLRERLLEEPDQVERINEHVAHEAEHDRRRRVSLGLEQQHQKDDGEDERPHQDMDRRHELDPLDSRTCAAIRHAPKDS